MFHARCHVLASFAVIAPLAILAIPPPAAAQVLWLGGSGSPNWSVGANWSSGVPASGINTQIVFDSSGTTLSPIQDLANPFLLNSLTFNVNAFPYNISGNGLDFRANSSFEPPQIVQNSASPITLVTNLTLNSNLVVAGTGGLTLSGAITGGGGLIKAGPGTLTLTNATNNYSLDTFVNVGRLALGADGTVIPAASNVIVAGGAEFNFGRFSNSTAIRQLFLNGGALRASGNGNSYALNSLMTSEAGGTVELGGSNLYFTNAGAGITINGNSTWTGTAGSKILNGTSTDLTITVVPNVTLISGLILYAAPNGFRLTGGGTLYLTSPATNYPTDVTVSQARLRVDDVLTGGRGALGPGLLTLDGGTLQYSGPNATMFKPLALGPGGGTVEVSTASSVLTLTGAGAVNGLGTLTKAGPGVLVLATTGNLYPGGITVSAGRLDVSDDAQLGIASLTVNPAGTLRYTANATTSRTFTLNAGTLEAPSGVTLTLNGATVGGGFLRGAGVISLTGNTSVFGATTLSSTTINQTGPATLTNFTNGGALTNSVGQTLTWNGSVNSSSGNVTVNGSVNVSDWSSNGIMTVNGGGAINNSTSSLVLGGGSRTTINPSATLTTAAGTSIELNGGLLVNNGTITGTTDVNYGSLAKGTGVYGIVNVNQGGIYAPGNSPGISTAAAATFDHTAVSSGAPVLEIQLAGTAPGTQYDQLHVTGQLALGGTLQVSLTGGFTPVSGNGFDILDWGSRSGTFSSIQVPTLDSTLAWSTYRLYTSGVLSVVDINFQPGDFNRDHQVTAADIPAMLTALIDLNTYASNNSLSPTQLAAIGDFDNSGTVTNRDIQGLLDLVASLGGGSAASVPEPASLVLLALAVPVVVIAPRRRKKVARNSDI